MNIDKEQAKVILEKKIERIVRNILNEIKDTEHEKLSPDAVENSKAFKRQYKTIQNELNRPEVNATQVMARALEFDPNDDAERSHAFKKLNREKTPSGVGTYEFSATELGKIANALQTR